MLKSLASLSFILVLFSSCEESDFKSHINDQLADAIPPVIHLLGKEIDTTYLQVSSTTLITNGVSGYIWHPGNSTSNYPDPGVEVLEVIDRRLRCSDLPVEITGNVNNKSEGVYLLHYNAKDHNGNKAATVSRTVHVVENNAAFLNGDYSVTCTCTVTTKNNALPIVTTSNYTANTFTSGKTNNHFKVSALQITTDYVMPSIYLGGDLLEVSFFSPDYDSKLSTGTLSPARNAFTIETLNYLWDASKMYKCRNVFTKIKSEELLTVMK